MLDELAALVPTVMHGTTGDSTRKGLVDDMNGSGKVLAGLFLVTPIPERFLDKGMDSEGVRAAVDEGHVG